MEKITIGIAACHGCGKLEGETSCGALAGESNVREVGQDRREICGFAERKLQKGSGGLALAEVAKQSDIGVKPSVLLKTAIVQEDLIDK